ncbi:hypothetical protein MKW94_001368 [Papaver nudicaule]|uniref:Polygalacturonase n=1 Tax=Papaver nudicaule TaxID=74823 RepID=A0AA41VER4_PAPNU|nr:hypothetical protein [Papaver nudicaule]
MANVRINTLVILVFLPLVFSNLADASGFIRKAGPLPAVFNVLKFGAVPNGREDCSEAFVQAWNAACHHPGGNAMLVVPPGNYMLLPAVFQGPCTGEVVVQVQGKVTGSDDVSEYSENQWILFENINGLVLTGGGIFNGNGADTWQYNDCATNPSCQPLAAGLRFSNVNKGTIGPLTSLNPQGYHMSLDRCHDFQINGVHINAAKTSPYTDGVHISGSTNVGISGSIIATGGNCISAGEGSTGVSVTKVTCGTRACPNAKACITSF